MIVIINGAFGIGKSTIAEILHGRFRGSSVFDPERIGYVLRRLPSFLPFSTRHLADYQDSPRWRSLTVSLASRRARRRDPVFIPMTFTSKDRLEEIRSGLEERGHSVLHLCLTASESTVHGRLAGRGVTPDSEQGRWVYPRASRACQLHGLPEFREQVPTQGRTPEQVADEICRRIEGAGGRLGDWGVASPSSAF